mmetsp:Transcript_7931/g.11481  ORF Transcript_7931/g.11481 Transcript_7931/m.11481 type:complete len:200 (-) Transcript_7931:300-899(-)
MVSRKITWLPSWVLSSFRSLSRSISTMLIFFAMLSFVFLSSCDSIRPGTIFSSSTLLLCDFCAKTCSLYKDTSSWSFLVELNSPFAFSSSASFFASVLCSILISSSIFSRSSHFSFRRFLASSASVFCFVSRSTFCEIPSNFFSRIILSFSSASSSASSFASNWANFFRSCSCSALFAVKIFVLSAISFAWSPLFVLDS